MRRKLQLLLLLLLIAGTTETGMRASTDCERWMAAYKTQLAQAKAVKRLQAAHARMKRLAQKKLANYVRKPAGPKPLRTHFVRPRYTRQQMLERFNIACGELPTTPSLVEGKITPDNFVSDMRSFEPVELASSDSEGLLPFGDIPPYTPTNAGTGGGGFTAPFSGGGIGGVGGGGIRPQTPSGPSTPSTPSTPIIPVTPVPEPGSIVMMLTGIGAAAGTVRQRFRG